MSSSECSKAQEVEKEQLRQKIAEGHQRKLDLEAAAKKEAAQISVEKVEQLRNEKKQVFKTMLKERKNVTKLEDQIDEYKAKISQMEEKMSDLRYKQQQLTKRQNEQKQSNRKKNAQRNKAFQIGSVMAGIEVPTFDLPNIGISQSARP